MQCFKFEFFCVYVLLLIVNQSESVNLPPEIRACKLSDAACITKSASAGFELFKKGIKEMGIPSTIPIRVNFIYLEGTGRALDMQQNYTNLEFSGIENSRLTDAKVDLNGDNCKIEFTFFNEKAKIEGQHELVGKLFFFAMKGGGDCVVDFTKLEIINHITCKKITKNGKQFLEVTDLKMDFQVPEWLSFYYENVVEGNKELSDEINRVAQENWKELYGDVKDNFAKGFAVAIKQYLSRFFSKVPLDKLFEL